MNGIADDLTKTPEQVAAEINAASSSDAATFTMPEQKPLPWDGKDDPTSRWNGTKIKLTAINRKRAEKGMQKEGDAILNTVRNGGRALEIKWLDNDATTRVSITDIYVVEVIELVDREPAQTVTPEVKKESGKPSPGFYVQPKGNGSVEQQKAMSYRGGFIATLLAMNGQLRAIGGDAYLDSEIKNVATDKIDALRDWISASIVAIQGNKPSTIEAEAMPSGISADVAERAKLAWEAGVKTGNGDGEQQSLGLYGLVMDGLQYRGDSSVSDAFRVLDDRVIYGEWTGGVTFNAAINRIVQVAEIAAKHLADITPREPRNTPTHEGAFNAAAAVIGDQLSDLKAGQYFGLTKILRSLYGTSGYSKFPIFAAYEAKVKELEAARREYFDLVMAAKDKTEAEAEAKEQALFTPFDPSKIKMPTAIQMGAKTRYKGGSGIRLFEEDRGWTNSHMQDVGALPAFIRKVTNETYGDRPLDTIPAFYAEKLVNTVNTYKTKVEPVADFDESTKNDSETKNIKIVILANAESGLAVSVDRRYFSYFFKTYKGAEFFASTSKDAVAVKKGGKVVGVIGPYNLAKKYNIFDKAMKASPNQATQQSETQENPSKIVDAAYQFANATDTFKKWIAESVNAVNYSPFLTAKAMDIAAKANGASIMWGEFGGATLDSAGDADEFVSSPNQDTLFDSAGGFKAGDSVLDSQGNRHTVAAQYGPKVFVKENTGSHTGNWFHQNNLRPAFN
jgi:hypothetical protein